MYVYLHKWWLYHLLSIFLRIKWVAIKNYTGLWLYIHSTYTPVYLNCSQTSISTPRRSILVSVKINALHIYQTLTIYQKVIWMGIKGMHITQMHSCTLSSPFPSFHSSIKAWLCIIHQSQAWYLYTVVLWGRFLMIHITYINSFLNFFHLCVCVKWYLAYPQFVI